MRAGPLSSPSINRKTRPEAPRACEPTQLIRLRIRVAPNCQTRPPALHTLQPLSRRIPMVTSTLAGYPCCKPVGQCLEGCLQQLSGVPVELAERAKALRSRIRNVDRRRESIKGGRDEMETLFCRREAEEARREYEAVIAELEREGLEEERGRWREAEYGQEEEDETREEALWEAQAQTAASSEQG